MTTGKSFFSPSAFFLKEISPHHVRTFWKSLILILNLARPWPPSKFTKCVSGNVILSHNFERNSTQIFCYFIKFVGGICVLLLQHFWFRFDGRRRNSAQCHLLPFLKNSLRRRAVSKSDSRSPWARSHVSRLVPIRPCQTKMPSFPWAPFSEIVVDCQTMQWF